MGTYYPIGGGEALLEKAEFADGFLPNLLGPIPPDPGTRYVLFSVRVRNTGAAPLMWDFERVNPRLQTRNAGDRVLRGATILTASNDKFERQPIQPGEEKALRFHFQVPLNAQLQSLTLGANGAQFRYDVSGVR